MARIVRALEPGRPSPGNSDAVLSDRLVVKAELDQGTDIAG